MKRLCIIGAGGHGKVVADYASQTQHWQSISFLDDAHPPGTDVGEWLVEGTIDCLPTLAIADTDVVVAIGDNQKRMEIIEKCLQWQMSLPILVHPTAVVSPRAALGVGSVVFANAVINIDAQCGKGCIINSGAIVEHDCVLGDGVHLSPNASLAGNAKVGDGSWIGIGASVKEGVTIGEGVILGAGSVAIADVENKAIAVGIPAKALST